MAAAHSPARRVLLPCALLLALGAACATAQVPDPEEGRPDTGPEAEEAADPVDLVTTPADEFGWVRVVLVVQPAAAAGQDRWAALQAALDRQLELEGVRRRRMIWHRGQLLVGISGARGELLRRVRAIFSRRRVLALKLVDDQSGHMISLSQRIQPDSGIRAFDEASPGRTGRGQGGVYLWSIQSKLIKEFLHGLPAGQAAPAGRVILLGDQLYNEMPGHRTYLLHSQDLLTEQDVQDARATPPRQHRPAGVLLTLTPGAAGRLERLTRQNLGRRLAMVVNGRVEAAPRIRAPIPGGKVQLHLGAMKSPQQQLADARQLAALLRTVPRLRQLQLVQLISLQADHGGSL